jgi:penicillin amidase
VLSIPARRIVLLLKDTQTQDLKVGEAISLLRNWDFRVTPESPAAALFQVWYDRHLAPALIAMRSPQGMAKLIDVADSTTLIGLLEQPAAKTQRDAIFVGTLRQAVAEMEQRQGANWLRWNWGDFHRSEFAHPLALLQLAQGALPAVSPRSRAGGAFTVAASPYRATGASTMPATGGASTRMVFDLANWDNALALGAPGQSGDLRSKHYADLVDAWTKDAPHPLLYSRGLIEKATALKIQLNPLP